MRVNEIFYSLQGEGVYSGTAAIFIRLSGCNLHCPFCDTEHASFKEMTCEEIYSQIKHYPSKHLVFTGGEPSLQLTYKTLYYFWGHGYFMQIETNGTNPIPWWPHCWITCSPKSDFCPNADIKIKDIDEIKVVFDGEHDPAKFLKIKASKYFLQPCDCGDTVKNREILNKCIKYILAHPKWQLSLQTQKLINVR